jgi:hypothetical protein
LMMPRLRSGVATPQAEGGCSGGGVDVGGVVHGDVDSLRPVERCVVATAPCQRHLGQLAGCGHRVQTRWGSGWSPDGRQVLVAGQTLPRREWCCVSSRGIRSTPGWPRCSGTSPANA